MSVIGKTTNEALNPMGNINIPAMEVPSFRYLLAQERKTIKNVLIMAPFALGDCICAEPAIRFATKYFKDCKVSLLTEFPEVFAHLEFAEVINSKDVKPDWDKYYVLKCYYAADELQSEFTHNFNMAIDDYIATCLFKGQVPVADRNIILKPSDEIKLKMGKHKVTIHAGRHWVSKTFPKAWWDEIIAKLVAAGITPTLVGADGDGGKRGTVDVDGSECMDYRNQLSVMESIAVLQNSEVVLTNDSSPFHMACSGNAWVGVFSTVRHFDFIAHWRPDEGGHNRFAYRTRDFAKGTMWNRTDTSPARNGAKYDVIDQETLMSWLPTPSEVVAWTLSKLTHGGH